MTSLDPPWVYLAWLHAPSSLSLVFHPDELWPPSRHRDAPNTIDLNWPTLHHRFISLGTGVEAHLKLRNKDNDICRGRSWALTLKGGLFNSCFDENPLNGQTGLLTSLRAQQDLTCDGDRQHLRAGSWCQLFSESNKLSRMALGLLYWWGRDRLGHVFKQDSVGAQRTRDPSPLLLPNLDPSSAFKLCCHTPGTWEAFNKLYPYCYQSLALCKMPSH